ncbi:hypothetical protein BI308_18380 [Roseofilum reptotaenium AO1-A]|uniref:Glycosyltransferase 2-like domain-containing protein n=1 Tax=Roseofilum reptotaenium AO1-A TaxID=1925591 RepID=A0A1L9QN96_9CYAN|nr:hypothetical protein BI308_18380 [Roseofilum reptotaenium AO1-A]
MDGGQILTWGLMVMQIPAIAILLFRLLKGPFRHPPIQPQSADLEMLGTVSVVVPTLNERDRLSPCLEGLTRQSYEVREVLVVDSHSTDGTGDLVLQTAAKDPRFRLLYDDPLPADWVGRPWALHTGFLHSSRKSEWIVGKVRMYEGAWQTWQEWGRSLDLKDATSPWQLWTDLWFLFAVQSFL